MGVADQADGIFGNVGQFAFFSPAVIIKGRINEEIIKSYKGGISYLVIRLFCFGIFLPEAEQHAEEISAGRGAESDV